MLDKTGLEGQKELCSCMPVPGFQFVHLVLCVGFFVCLFFKGPL